MIPHHDPYVVLAPGMRTNATKKHAVVNVGEWLAITLGEKEHYESFSEHDSYDSAAVERDNLNHPQQEMIIAEVSEDEEIAV